MSIHETSPGTVAVLGNGPVGQTTALLLARWGIRVILLDGRTERDPIGSKAICQQRDVLDIWDSVGAGRQIAEEGLTWGLARTFHGDAELFAQTFVDHGQSCFPPFVNISQTRTEQLLDERIAATPSIEVRWGHRIETVRQDDAAVYIECGTDSGPVMVSADYGVVALGSRAGDIRAQLGVSFDGRSFEDKFLICDIAADLPGWANERRFYFDPEWNPGRQVLIHPCPDSTFRIDWQVPGDYDLDAEEASGALDARIRQIIGDTDYRIVWKSVYRFHSRVASSMRIGRFLLAGDAAHIVSPFGARGLNSGVADAENAAWKLAYVLHGWASDDLLDTYHTERHAAAVENLAVTAATMDFLVPQNADQARTRTQILDDAHRDPKTHARVDSGRLAEPFWYADSPLTTPNPLRPFAGRPDRGHAPIPAPGVLVPDLPVQWNGQQTRLRALARNGFLLLTSDATVAATGGVGPVTAAEISDLDPSGALGAALDARPGEAWLIRPDAHIAGVLDSPDVEVVDAALMRAVALSTPEPVAG